MQAEEQGASMRLMDQFILDFQRLRLDAGELSYTQIAERVRTLRESRGLTPAQAFVGRSTVYDAFRSGRRRINPGLVADIATVLGEDAERAAWWQDYCVRARRDEAARADASTRIEASDRTEGTARADASARIEAPVPAAASAHALASLGAVHRVLPFAVSLTVLMGAIVNAAGTEVVLALSLPIYLDMIGTAIVAMALGPWYGVLTAVISHGLVALLTWSPEGIPFVLVNAVGALLWGYGVRSWGMGKTPLRFLALTLLVAVSSTVIAAPIILTVYGGLSVNVGAQGVAAGLQMVGDQIWASVFSANIITSIMDKLIAGFVALAVLPVLLPRLPERFRTDAQIFSAPRA